MMFGYQPGWGWMMMVMPLLWLGVLVVVAWAVVRLVPRGGGVTHPAPPRETPREVLDRRLASGDIDAETYTRTRDQLAGRDRETR
ncbi:MAG TPA: hypothetical protein VJT31_25080 [Rugosimonospora sp.]|nr:hypothetical protein [Rugosimonospora sp.]